MRATGDPMQFTPRIERAFSMARQLHTMQTRKGNGSPYIAHLLAVASLVIENGGTEDEAIAALLHDSVEDQGGLNTLHEIRAQFGDSVSEIVDECTDSFDDPKPPWKERKKAFIESISQKSKSAALVLLADATHNAGSLLNDFRSIGDDIWEQFNGGKTGTLWYYRSLAEVLNRSGSSNLVQQLQSFVVALDRCDVDEIIVSEEL